MSRRLNEIKTSLNSQIQNAITAAITDTVLPSIQNVLEMQGRPNFTVVDRASNGPHPGPRTGYSTVEDQRSSGRQRNPEVGNFQKSWENRPKSCFTQEKCGQRSRESSVGSYTDEQNRDMVTGANLTTHMFPEFLTGRPMQYREPLQRQNSNADESLDHSPQVQEPASQTIPSDPINRLAEVLVGMNNRPSAVGWETLRFGSEETEKNSICSNGCESWWHGSCGGLDVKDLPILSKYASVYWYCSKCEDKHLQGRSSNVWKYLKAINQQQKND